MKITEFFEFSFGQWRSQRHEQSQHSGYHLVFARCEEVHSTKERCFS